MSLARGGAALALLLTGLLSACSSGGDDGASTTSFNPATLCLSGDCRAKTTLLDIPSAENMLFAPGGRFFVSGGENVYEITRSGDTWNAQALYDGSCNFTGLALRGDVLYANCFDGSLYAGSISASPVKLQAIHDMGLGAPNGLAAGPDNTLYVINGPIATSALPDPKIVRLTLDPADPLKVTGQTDWLATGALTFPNGLRIKGNTLYFTESSVLPVALGAVMTVEIQSDGSPGTPTTFGTFPGLPDDMSLAGDYVLLASYSNNQVALFDPSGTVISQSPLLSFDSPSCVMLGQPPLFNADDIVVTEKGIIGLPPTPGYGSKLTVYRRQH